MQLAKIASVLAVAGIIAGCASGQMGPERTLAVHWQRLTDQSGRTCERCGATQTEVRLATAMLRRCLRPLNMKVTLEETPITSESFARDTSQSNRILLDDRPLEDWLGATAGMSPCGSCCQQIGRNVECRTLTVGCRTYEAIPAALIVRAGLLAAEAALAKEPEGKPCCPGAGPSAERPPDAKALFDRRP